MRCQEGSNHSGKGSKKLIDVIETNETEVEELLRAIKGFGECERATIFLDQATLDLPLIVAKRKRPSRCLDRQQKKEAIKKRIGSCDATKKASQMKNLRRVASHNR